jgi:hypothetical protein
MFPERVDLPLSADVLFVIIFTLAAAVAVICLGGAKILNMMHLLHYSDKIASKFPFFPEVWGDYKGIYKRP